MSDNAAPAKSGCITDIIVAVIVMVILFFLFKYIWQGVTWAFGQYVDLLRVN